MGLGFPFGVMKILWNQIEVAVNQLCAYIQCHCILHFKMVHFIFCEFHSVKKYQLNTKKQKTNQNSTLRFVISESGQLDGE